jgi:hypothetical protein
MAESTFIEQLRQTLPRLLQEHPEVRHEVWGLMLEAFPARQEFLTLLEEIRAARQETNQRFEAADRRFEALRQDMNQRFEAADRRFEALRQDMNQRFETMNQRFEAADRRFEALRQDMNQRFETMNQRFEASDRRIEALRQDMNQRFEAVMEELRDQRRQIRETNVHLSALGSRVGYGLEYMVQGIVEEFAGQSFPVAERLVLRDEAGEVFGVAGAEVEFDLYAHNGTAYLVEVKSHLKTSDVLSFHRKVQFAARRLGRQVVPLIIALSMDPRTEPIMRQLGVQYRVRAAM